MSESQFSVNHLSVKELRQIFSKIRLSKTKPIHNCPCWLWTGAKSQAGYGWVQMNRKRIPTHRLLYAFVFGSIPKGVKEKHVDHLCNTKNCVNPVHLLCVSPRENILRGSNPAAINASRINCHHGHPLEIISNDNHRRRRSCKTCSEIYLAGYYQRPDVIERRKRQSHERWLKKRAIKLASQEANKEQIEQERLKRKADRAANSAAYNRKMRKLNPERYREYERKKRQKRKEQAHQNFHPIPKDA